MPKLAALFLLFITSLQTNAATALSATDPTRTFSSGETQVDLLELYTSEGCSSCPPAEAWFSKLLEHAGLWRGIVPVVFHVDYWNDLGWKDPYSSPENSQRQRRYQSEGGVHSVYTPGFVINGNEWRGWFTGQALPESAAPAGVLIAAVESDQIQATYRSEQHSDEALELHVALLGFDLTTTVARGENRGKDLTHQFVVLNQVTALSNDNSWNVTVPESPVATTRLALAVWITRPNTQRSLQATGGWLRGDTDL
jgi:hypothetical protein